jgi:transposase
MKAYSADLRHKIVYAYEQGEGTLDEIAAIFDVGRCSIARYLKLHRSGESLQPQPHGGGVAFSLTQQHLSVLQKQVEAKNDITLAELVAYLAKKEKVAVHPSTVCRALQRLGLPRKKRVLRLPKEMKQPESCFVGKFLGSRASDLFLLTNRASIWQWHDSTDAPDAAHGQCNLSRLIAASMCR